MPDFSRRKTFYLTYKWSWLAKELTSCSLSSCRYLCIDWICITMKYICWKISPCLNAAYICTKIFIHINHRLEKICNQTIQKNYRPIKFICLSHDFCMNNKCKNTEKIKVPTYNIIKTLCKNSKAERVDDAH